MAERDLQPAQDAALAEKAALLQMILDDSDQLVQMSYLDDMTMVYVNAAAKAYRGGDEDPRGRHCYEYMMGLDAQCPFCPLLTQAGERAGSTEVDNGVQVFSVKTMLVEIKGRPAFIEYAADVTPSRRAQQGFERQMRTLLSSIPEAQGIMHFDLTADICISVNGSAINSLKCIQAEVAVDTTLAQTLSFIPDEAKRAETSAVFNRAALIDAFNAGTVEVSREVESYFDDGSIRWARLVARLIHNPTNGHLECVLYGIDISDEVARRHALEERAHRHLVLFNSLARDYLNVYLIDPDNDRVSVLKLDGFVTQGLEEGAERTYPYQVICERYIAERVHPDDREMVRSCMAAANLVRELADKPEYVGTYRVLDKGEVHYYQFKYLLAEHGQGILAGFQNADAVIAAEREQQELLKGALAQAEAASVAKSAFLSSMSHDIRTPLNAIIGFNDLARQHLGDEEATRRYLEKAQVASKHLLSIVNDVLDMSRIESGTVKLDEAPIHLPAFFDELRAIVSGNAQAAGVALAFDTHAVRHEDVLGDELKIKKILMNILGNAVKFTKPGGQVSFSVEERNPRGSDVAHFLFHVRDTGVGMSEEFKDHAFEPFARENDAAHAGVGGTGLGLSIVRSLVNIMDGTVRLESELGVGTEFTVSLHLRCLEAKPAEAPEDSGDSETQLDVSDLAGMRILLAEDNELNREIAFEILTEAGFEVDSACDGARAVQAVSAHDPGFYDVVLMDIQMPVMNGYEAARAIRALPDTARAQVPIIAVTANAFSSDRDAALVAGMDGHVAKPIDLGALVAKMREVIR